MRSGSQEMSTWWSPSTSFTETSASSLVVRNSYRSDGLMVPFPRTPSSHLALVSVLRRPLYANPKAKYSLGPRACVGKRLAMVELRIILAHIALNFDLEFADERLAKAFITQGKDTVTYTVPPLPLYFHDRKM